MFLWTLSGLIIGNCGVVAANWDEVVKQSNFGDSADHSNLMFQYTPHYSIYTSLIYSIYISKKYHNNDFSRTVPGINVELFLHYILYGVGNEHGTN